MTKITPSARRKARRLALQALYQWQMSGSNISEIQAQFHTFNDMSKVDVHYFHELLQKIPQHLSDVDEYYTSFLDRPIEKLNPIELAVLRIGSYELVKRIDVPYRVVIDESLRLAKSFGSEEGHKYVNGVLDKVAKEYRNIELEQ